MKKAKEFKVKVSVEKEVPFHHLLHEAIMRHSAKRIVCRAFDICLFNSSISESPILLALTRNKKEIDKLVENTEASYVLGYAIKHWDDLKELGKKQFEDAQKGVK